MAAKDGGDAKSGIQIETAAGTTINVGGLPIPLKKTARAIDRLISVPFDVWADQLDSKMRGNTDKHVEAVQRHRAKNGRSTSAEDASVKNAKALAEWTASASEVGEEDQDLSAMWRGILDAILGGRDDPDELLRVVKATRSSDLRWFLGRSRTTPVMQAVQSRLGLRFSLLFAGNSVADGLRASGLIENLVPRGFFFLLAALAGSMAIFFYLRSATSLDFKLPLFFPEMLATSLLLVGLLWLLQRPTEIGHKLLGLHHKYINERR